MKLGRVLSSACVLVVFTMGCGARSSTPVAAPRSPVSTVRLMAAELRDADDAPKVSKSQRAQETIADEDETRRSEPSRGAPDRKRGGFSGYK